MLEARHPDVRLVLHGHFYQPPRESPWTDAIPEQSSAHPDHDWNERILVQCYRPSTASRVLDGYGRIRRIVNNFEHMSFNVGPTLFTWLEREHADVYARILDADRRSRAVRSGHGNAIAQAYNHMILPLANARDRCTQVRWGLRDFELRFGRAAEGMWLPETAIHADTIDTLVDCGVRFTILSPYQARRVRPLAGGDWLDVGGGRIDARVPYVVRGSQRPDGSTRELAVFFYDGPVSQAIAFESLLRSADTLAERLALVADPARDAVQVVSVAVDGETFGHHEAFGDMCLASFFSDKARARGFRATNYGELLDELQPAHVVELETGGDGEGTAWSCAHGVGRWTRDCGCSTGAPEGWNQAWRGPLRLALDRLRDVVAELFEQRGARLLKDPWAARDEYVDVVVRDADPAAQEEFLERHLKSSAGNGREDALTLLEAQRHSMAMYTSCAWFFADVTGIETVQNLRYAARCVQLMREFSAANLENALLTDLKEVHSNNGRDTGTSIYDNWIRPDIRTPRHAVTSRAVFEWLGLEPEREQSYGYDMHEASAEAVVVCGHGGQRGHLQLRHRWTGEMGEYSYIALQLAPRHLACWVAGADLSRHEQLARECARLRSDLGRVDLMRILTDLYGVPVSGIGDLLHAQRRRIAECLAGERISAMRVHYRALYDDSTDLLRDFAEMGLEPPAELRIACEFSAQTDVEEAAGNLQPPFDEESTAHLRTTLTTARELGLRIRPEPVAACISRHLETQVRGLVERSEMACREAAHALLALAEEMQLQVDRTEAEELMNMRLQQLLLSGASGDTSGVEEILELASHLNFAVEEWKAAAAAPPSETRA
jgi:hypothetical protein